MRLSILSSTILYAMPCYAMHMHTLHYIARDSFVSVYVYVLV